MRLCLVLAMFGLGVASAAPADLPQDMQPRYAELIEELRCLVCQNQNLAESNAELAVDLKRQVADLMREGRSDAEIKTYLQARYGDFVLYEPPFKPETWVLWIGPFVLLGGVLLVVVWRLRRREERSATPEPVDRAAIQHLLDD